jgi:hypothetical protein
MSSTLRRLADSLATGLDSVAWEIRQTITRHW